MGCVGSSDAVERAGKDLFHEKYKLGKQLGKGSFAQVCEAQQRSSKTVHAVKIVDLVSGRGGNCVDKERLQEAQDEADVMRQLGSHPHIAQLSETFLCHSQFYLVMERCQGSLSDRLDSIANASETYVKYLLRDMLLGIAYIHQANLVHCDVKPSNFLLGGVNGETVKLADFDMARKMASKGYLIGQRGTPPYMSPEVVARRPYGFKTDVWSMGVCAYLLLYGDFPYVPSRYTAESMKQLILLGEPAPRFVPLYGGPPTSTEAQCFVRRLMARDHAQRCTAQEALELAFVCLDVADETKPSSRIAREEHDREWPDILRIVSVQDFHTDSTRSPCDSSELRSTPSLESVCSSWSSVGILDLSWKPL